MKKYNVPVQSLIDHIKTALDVDPWAKEMAEDLLKDIKVDYSFLKPCPFCGKEPECVHEYGYTGLHEGGWYWVVRCNYLNGGCGGHGGSASSEEEAIKNWNNRA